MIRWLYWIYQAISTATHWLARRLTPAGRIVVMGILLTTFLGADLERATSPRMLLLGAILLLVAAGFSPFFQAKFEVDRHLPRVASLGEPVSYCVRVVNHSSRNLTGLEVLEEITREPLSYASFAARLRPSDGTRHLRLAASSDNLRRCRVEPAVVPRLNRGDAVAVHLSLIPRRRGLLHFGAIGIARTDPCGLFRSVIRVVAPQTLIVLPRRYRMPVLELPGAPKYQPGGVALASRVGESEEFLGLREYRAGDSLRHIHWRSWARAGAPVTKEYQDECFTRHALILDSYTTPDNAEVFEEAVSVAASVAAQTHAADSLLDLMFTGDRAYRITAGRGLAPVSHILEILAAVPLATDPSFVCLHRLVLDHAHELQGAVCVLVAWDDARRQLVEQLMARGVVVRIFLILPQAAGPSEPPSAPRGVAGFHVLTTGRVREDLARIPNSSDP